MEKVYSCLDESFCLDDSFDSVEKDIEAGSCLLGDPITFSIKQEFPVEVLTPTLSSYNGQCLYSFGTPSGLENYHLPAYSLSFLQLAGTIGDQPEYAGYGYSGKLNVALQNYRFFSIRGFRLTYINNIPSGSSQFTQFTLPPIAFTILPSIIPLSGNPLDINTETTPFDIYEYDNTLKVQPNNALGKGISKSFYFPDNISIIPEFIDSSTPPIPINSIMDSSLFKTLACVLVLGFKTYPLVPTTYPISRSIIGSIRIETLIDFFIPIKNQVI